MIVEKRDIKLVKFFLNYYNERLGHQYSITSQPDKVERNKEAVEAIATDENGHTLAIEHTLMQPFVDDKADTQPFLKTLGPLEKDGELVVPDYSFTISIPVGAISKGIKWPELKLEIKRWFQLEKTSFPLGRSTHNFVHLKFALPVTIEKHYLPGDKGSIFIARSDMPDNLTDVLKKALSDKVLKLVAASAQNRILLLEKDSPPHGYTEIAKNIEGLSVSFIDLKMVDQIWVVNTVVWESENNIWFIPVWPESLRGYPI